MFIVTDYFEDEHGNEITLTEIVCLKEGRNDIVTFPSHYRPHDIELSLSENTPVPENPQDHIRLSQGEVDTLAYFVNDVTELVGNAFYRAPPTLHSAGDTFKLSTIPVEHIVAFVTTFRRLYMEKERGNCHNACTVYARHFLNKRLAKWITEERRSYHKFLTARARLMIVGGQELSFTNRTLISVLLNTRFAHQPKDDLREQYEQCLNETGDEARLEWMFCMTMFEASLYYVRANSVISNELGWYLKATGRSPTFDLAPYQNERGRGEMPTAKQLHVEQLLRQAERLGYELWEQAGSPDRQLEQFVRDAEATLREEARHPPLRHDALTDSQTPHADFCNDATWFSLL